MTQIGDVLGPHEDVLDSGTPGGSGRWIAIAVVAVLALVGWNLLDSGPEQAVDRAVDSPAVDPPADRVIEPVPEESLPTDRADQLTFVDDAHGFLVQYACPLTNADASCPRRIVATSDGGASWEVRGPIPPHYAEHYYQLAAASRDQLMLIDGATLASIALSVDGGRSWRQLPVTPAEAAPAPAGATLTQSAHRCDQVCKTTLGWIDPAALKSHPLPSQPVAGSGDVLALPSMSSDGDIVVSSVAGTAGQVSMSTDGGQTWSDTRLEVPLVSVMSQQYVQVWAAGGGRAYAVVQVYDGVGTESTYGFRTDDGGLTWADLRLEGQAVGTGGVLGGELITTDLSGQIFVSSAGGTRWDEVGTVLGTVWLAQTVPDGPVLATMFDDDGEESYQLSIDGRSWVPVSLPEM
ncbi:MAG: hypothetical protein H0U09_13190 [Geodermatophilaceae bacterium]|nr:hypothetical protein [Geodermatophilaceae bacterium]